MKMEKPTAEAVRFDSADVIATSGERGVWLGGFGDNTSGNWFVSGTKGAESGANDADADTINGYLRDASNGQATDYQYTSFYINTSDAHFYGFLSTLPQYEEDSGASDYNGWYVWYTDGYDGYFGKQ